MKDLITKGEGDSRYLKSNFQGTWEEALAMLTAGTFPVDFNGLNEDAVVQAGMPLSKANLLSDETGLAIFGADYSTEKTPNNALYEINNVAQNASVKAELLRTIAIPTAKSTTIGLFLAADEIEDGCVYYWSITGQISSGKVNLRNSRAEQIAEMSTITTSAYPLLAGYPSSEFSMMPLLTENAFEADEICATGRYNEYTGAAFLNIWRAKI